MPPLPPVPAAPFRSGAAVRKITPAHHVFLYGYPHVPRQSTGVHDDLLCSALYMEGAGGGCLILANDLIFVARELVDTVRTNICMRTGLPSGSIAVCATHTHSGPVTVNYLSNRNDPVVPKAAPAYLHWLTEQLTAAGCEAIAAAQPAEIAITTAEVSGVGSNRHDKHGPADHQALVMAVRRTGSQEMIACAITYAMHPTVLHEDSTLISSDFPHFTREFLREALALPPAAAVLFLNGASGNQSPRHTARSNTFEEARRLGCRLGECIARDVANAGFTDGMAITVARTFVDLQPRAFPAEGEARQAMKAAEDDLRRLQDENAPRSAVRTAECDLFGAEETLALAQSAQDGSLAQAMAGCLPAEIQLFCIGELGLVFWPGEFFVEYALEIKARHPHAHIVTLANGVLQGYIVTPEAERRKLYESGNAVFSAQNGRRFVKATQQLLDSRPPCHVFATRD